MGIDTPLDRGMTVAAVTSPTPHVDAARMLAAIQTARLFPDVIVAPRATLCWHRKPIDFWSRAADISMRGAKAPFRSFTTGTPDRPLRSRVTVSRCAARARIKPSVSAAIDHVASRHARLVPDGQCSSLPRADDAPNVPGRMLRSPGIWQRFAYVFMRGPGWHRLEHSMLAALAGRKRARIRSLTPFQESNRSV